MFIVILLLAALLLQLNNKLNNIAPAISASPTPTITPTSTTATPVDFSNGIPLGDYKYATSAQTGYIYVCQTTFNGGGAFAAGDWIDQTAKTWFPDKKPTVDGDVAWDAATVEFTLNGSTRIVTGNGLPTNHNTGTYPVAPSDDAYQFDRNPNSIKETQVLFNLPANPVVATTPHCTNMGTIGIALNGVAIFNGLDAQGKDAVANEIQDKCDGHPEMNGQYHYHNLSRCLEDNSKINEHSDIIGYALDGFGIFGKRSENGVEVHNSDLDECHGHTHEILWDGKTVNMYHYHTTTEYPYTIGCFKGTPVTLSNQQRPPRP